LSSGFFGPGILFSKIVLGILVYLVKSPRKGQRFWNTFEKRPQILKPIFETGSNFEIYLWNGLRFWHCYKNQSQNTYEKVVSDYKIVLKGGLCLPERTSCLLQGSSRTAWEFPSSSHVASSNPGHQIENVNYYQNFFTYLLLLTKLLVNLLCRTQVTSEKQCV
jgi:hypothetical protein